MEDLTTEEMEEHKRIFFQIYEKKPKPKPKEIKSKTNI